MVSDGAEICQISFLSRFRNRFVMSDDRVGFIGLKPLGTTILVFGMKAEYLDDLSVVSYKCTELER